MLEISAYDLLIVSPIRIVHSDGAYYTLDLWARDIVEQCKWVGKLGLVAPVSKGPAGDLVRLPDSVDVFIDGASQLPDRVAEIVSRYTVVQVHSASTRYQKRVYAEFAKAAQELRKLLILSISSNRAKTLTINAEHRGPIRRLQAWFLSGSLMRNIRRLSSLADGVLLTGHGLIGVLEEPRCQDVHIGIASWIEERDIIEVHAAELKGAEIAEADGVRLCIACRLERMKGVSLGLDALKLVTESDGNFNYRLTIVGQGPERKALEEQVSRLGLKHCVEFIGTVGYPEPFLSVISKHHILLMTNLNEEQPRVLFDALSQGVFVLVPDSRPYRELPLGDDLFYSHGDARSLADAILRLFARARNGSLLPVDCREVASMFTLQKMHEKRSRWIVALLEGTPL